MVTRDDDDQLPASPLATMGGSNPLCVCACCFLEENSPPPSQSPSHPSWLLSPLGCPLKWRPEEEPVEPFKFDSLFLAVMNSEGCAVGKVATLVLNLSRYLSCTVS